MIFFITVFLSICRCGVDKWDCKCCFQDHKRSSLPLTSVSMNKKKWNTMEIRDPYRMYTIMLLFAFIMLLTYNLNKICARSRKFICVRFFFVMQEVEISWSLTFMTKPILSSMSETNVALSGRTWGNSVSYMTI